MFCVRYSVSCLFDFLAYFTRYKKVSETSLASCGRGIVKAFSVQTWSAASKHRQAGFSLLEVTIALSISGLVFGSLWQLTAVAGQQREAAYLSSQMQTVGTAARDYISVNAQTLLALPQLATLNSTARIKVMSVDTGNTADSLESAGFLPAGFIGSNSYNQTYVLYVRREDSGTVGVVDASDKLVGLLFTSGGKAINDTLGARITSNIGTSGGFIYASGNPAPPAAATTVTGANGGWTIALGSTGWSSIGILAQAGHIASLVNLMPGSGSGYSPFDNTLNGLADVQTDYSSKYNMFAGSSTPTTYGVGGYSTAMGASAMANVAPTVLAANNTAFGYLAQRGFGAPPTGVNNTTLGYYSMKDNNAGARNTAVGYNSLQSNQGNSDNTAIGLNAAIGCFGLNDITAIGFGAGAGGSGGCGSGSHTYIGAYASAYQQGASNTMVGAFIGHWAPHSGSYNVGLGYRTFYSAAAALTYSTFIGHKAGETHSTGNYNLLIGAGTAASSTTASYETNIGNTLYVMGSGNTITVSQGTQALASGVSYDLGNNTGLTRIANGTTAQRPTCDATSAGAFRYNASTDTFEMCSNSAWVSMVLEGGSAVSTPPGSGFFVLSATPRNGNLGGLAGANSTCLSDLTSYDWAGKADAVSRGQLVAGKVRAWLTTSGTNNNVNASTTYYFARAGRPDVGGATFTSDASQKLPMYTTPWSGQNYFGGSVRYWIGSRDYASTYANTGGCCTGYCSNWADGSSGQSTGTGTAAGWGYERYTGGASCDTPLYMICLVQP